MKISFDFIDVVKKGKEKEHICFYYVKDILDKIIVILWKKKNENQRKNTSNFEILDT